MEQNKGLLRDGRLSLSDVALSCGFADQSHFTRVFTKLTGLTPGAWRREGPYRFIQNRSRTSVVALKSDATAEKSKEQLSRDFPGRSIFDFCNNICK